jgi:hypothetical protein
MQSIVLLYRKYLRLFAEAFPAGQLHDIGSIVSAGASIVGGMMGSKATKSAADTQAEATRAGIAEQRRQYDMSREDQRPFRETGVAANQRLAFLLGLDVPAQLERAGVEPGGGMSAPTSFRPGESNDPVWEQILGDFNRSHEGAYGTPMNRPWDSDADAQNAYDALSQQYRERKGAEAPAQTGDPNADPKYGSLLRKFGLSDMEADPVYQTGLKFGLDRGIAGVNQRAIAGGGFDSGATLKALTRYANDYGSTKANESYNRFRSDQDSTYNKLAGISGSGQVATNQIQAAGTNMANNVTELNAQAGNARAAGIVGGANAWGGAMGGVTGAMNNYQNNRTLERIMANRGSGGGFASFNPTASYLYGTGGLGD